VIGMMMTSRILEEAWRSGETEWIRERLERALDLACEIGCRTVGLAGFLSIASYNGKKLATTRIGLTTGNALTVGIGIESIRRHALREGIELAAGCLGAVGAAGNVCSTYVRMMADEVGRFVLVGRPNSVAGLENTAAVMYEDAWEKITSTPEQELRGLALRIASTDAVRRLRRGSPGEKPAGIWLHRALSEELGPEAPILLADDLARLIHCNLIVTASNSSDPILFEEHLGPGPIVICDIAVPVDVSPTVRKNRPDVVVTTGGCVRMPGHQDMKIAALPLPDGHVYACLAETMVLGLARRSGHYSFGQLEPAHVKEMLELAGEQGFVLGDDISQSGSQALQAQ
jgi:predicted amino acid dehydrogenase